MADFVEIKDEDLNNLPIVSSPEEALEKGIKGYRTEEGGPIRIAIRTGPEVTLPKPKPKNIISESKSKVAAPKLMTEPLNVGERSGIVTPSTEIVREPIKGKVGFKEKEIAAPMAGLKDRVPVDTDKLGKATYGTLEKAGTEDIEQQKMPIPFEDFKEKRQSYYSANFKHRYTK